jgi:hypothetical protein
MLLSTDVSVKREAADTSPSGTHTSAQNSKSGGQLALIDSIPIYVAAD